jgi:hypothetical protein
MLSTQLRRKAKSIVAVRPARSRGTLFPFSQALVTARLLLNAVEVAATFLALFQEQVLPVKYDRLGALHFCEDGPVFRGMHEGKCITSRLDVESAYSTSSYRNLLSFREQAMSDLMVSVSHRLSQDEALRRIRAVVSHAKVQYADKINDLRDSWNGYVGTFDVSGMGQKASGNVAVNPSDVTVQIKLPFAALLFKSKIESRIRDTLTRILA